MAILDTQPVQLFRGLSVDGTVSTSASEAEPAQYVNADGDTVQTVTLNGNEYLRVGPYDYLHVAVSMDGTAGDASVYTMVSEGDTEREVRSETGIGGAESGFEVARLNVQGATYARVTLTESGDVHIGGA